MAITDTQFKRGCAWCDKPIEAGEDKILVTTGRPGEVPANFYAHVACFVASLSPRAREVWEKAPR